MSIRQAKRLDLFADGDVPIISNISNISNIPNIPNIPNMQNSKIKLWILGAILGPLLLVSASHAQVYKWVDARGQTHYSTNKDDAGAARTDIVKLPTQPAQPPIARPSADYLRDSSKQSQSPTAPENGVEQPPQPRPPRSLSGGKEDGTDASRCALGRDVLSGAVKHSNGKPTDKYDLEVAQNDVRAFCRQR